VAASSIRSAALQFLDDFVVDERFRTHGRTVTEADVANYAGVTGDINPLHMDEEYARQTRYGRRLPHGQLIFSLSLGLAERAVISLIQDAVIAFYGVDRMRFIRPVFIGDTIHLERRIAQARPRDESVGLLTFDDEVKNQDGVLCMRYSPIYLVRRRPV
jgi:3-hydroxybutyryl-CoA dehydratase